ncbi:PREDICTED: uncharacterized protein LOC109226165 [Nicotiana attenuata]|uniref:uncharacterized protein LOC109226165 n=1 Tax=Nicotiana attenuata TaxID=49451 RepID=UPI000904E507|nr:PREDICTED: uncharacterized protein LOC109226165 [Nicotiana attenuata]
MVRDALDKVKLIQDCLWIVQSRHRSYADMKVCGVAFMDGEKILLLFLPVKGVMRFGKKGKLSLRFIVPFEILKGVGEGAYRLTLPPMIAGLYSVFHVSMLKKYHEDKSHILDFSTVQLDENMIYEEESVAIVDRQVRKLRSKDVPSV